jgi:succinate-semialdehyde dehydrogenase/glutarate-semialdehyde dehydrogenase
MRLQDASLLCSKCYVGGAWVEADSNGSFPVMNKTTGDVICTVPNCGKSETDHAIASAAEAFKAWGAMTGKERGLVLHRWHALIHENIDDLALILTLEQGKPLAESKGEILLGCTYIDWFAEEGRRAYGEVIPSPWSGKQPLAIRQPIGVAAAITPWNFPSSMITRKAAPALAAGCPVIVKPASATPLSALALGVLAERAGFPAGVFSVITGNAREIGDALCQSPTVRALSFTGSTPVGKKLMAQCAQTMKKLSLELGGNAPFLVFEKGDVEDAVRSAVGCKFRNAGQTCICANRFLVEDAVHDEFVERLKTEVGRIILGDGTKSGVTQGPLIDGKAIAFMHELLQDATGKGATIVCGGKPSALGGNFFEPTIVTGVTRDMRIFQEEIFGPIAPILRFSSEEEAIELANDTPYGLASYVFSRDLPQLWRVVTKLEYGLVGANEVALASGEVPFGGVKDSGLGREGGRQGLDEYLETKYILLGGLDKR